MDWLIVVTVMVLVGKKKPDLEMPEYYLKVIGKLGLPLSTF